jgi:DNA-directed RNA polymerase subunit RPC12/RpoP
MAIESCKAKFRFRFIKDSEYYCPECSRTLFSKEEEAIAFLKGE